MIRLGQTIPVKIPVKIIESADCSVISEKLSCSDNTAFDFVKKNTRQGQLEKKIKHYMGKAISDYHMIQPHDRILVCLSGGKDSWTLLDILEKIRIRAKVPFELLSFTLDQNQPGWQDGKLKSYLADRKIPHIVFSENTYDIVKEKTAVGKTYCSLCSRLRRGIIYRYARDHGFNKIALGHHRDDLITSLLMSIFYQGEMSSMPPTLRTDDDQLTLIRPLVYCQEKDIQVYAALKQFPIIPCNLCGSQENLMRKKTAKLIQMLAQDNPKIPSNILHALQAVRPSQLMDRQLWDFQNFEIKTKKIIKKS